jgi:hypothetical protein
MTEAAAGIMSTYNSSPESKTKRKVKDNYYERYKSVPE